MLEELASLDAFIRRIDRFAPPAQVEEGALDAGSPEQLYRYANDPVGYAKDVFGVDLWEGQQKICTAMASHDAVACKSGHKCGKSTVAAILAWWFASTRGQARVIITAPTDRQVKQVVWREVRRLWRESLKKVCLSCGERASHGKICACGGELAPPAVNLPEPAKAPDTGISLPNDSQILGFTAANQEAMAGISSPEMLYIVDEASGVDEKIFEAIEGNLAADARILLISNPTRTVGQFFRAFHQEKAEWATVTMSSEDTPSFESGGRIIRGLASKKWVAKRARIWGVDDPRYQVRVRGNFPRQAANSVVSIGLLEMGRTNWRNLAEEAKARGSYELPDGILKIGVDVARFGDDASVSQPVRGTHTFHPKSVNGYDTIQVAGMVLEQIRDPKLRASGERAEIRIDAGGGYGGGVADNLRYIIEEDLSLSGLVRVIEVHPSAKPNNDTEYARRRDELWFGIRSYIQEGGTIPPDCDDLEEELIAPTYKFTRTSQMQVESKDEMKAQLGRSPDYADALALAVCNEHDILFIDPSELEIDDVSRWGDDDDGARGFG